MRFVEAYVGEYASGKSEVAINRGRELLSPGGKVTLADLDVVEPFYTLGSLKEALEREGLEVLSRGGEKPYGLGETGNLLQPSVRWALRRRGSVIFDVGHGPAGSQALNLVEGFYEDEDARVFAVVNAYRPLTSTPERIARFIPGLGRVDGIVNNSHLGEATTLESIHKGAAVVGEGASLAGLPLVAAAVAEAFRPSLAESPLLDGVPLRYLKLYFSGKNRTDRI